MKHCYLYCQIAVIAMGVWLSACSTPAAEERSPIVVSKVDFAQIIDSLTQQADTIFTDTATYKRRPKAMLYVHNGTNVVTQVFSDTLGNIGAMIDYRDGEVLTMQEFYPNGQRKYRFSYDQEYKRNGPYTWYYEDGRVKMTGEHKDDEEVVSTRKMFDKEGYLIKQ